MAISDTAWARIYAKAWYESSQGQTGFQDNLELDPAKAINALRSQFGIGRADTIVNMDYDCDSVAQQLKDSANKSLLEQVIKSGNLNEQQISGGMWIRPNPLEEIPLPERAVNPAISPADWTRIYAYIWHRYIHGDVATRAEFEKDPASALPQIVADIKTSYKVTIDYTKGVTRFLDLGLPPRKDEDPMLLKSIQDAPDAKKYRHKPCLCC